MVELVAGEIYNSKSGGERRIVRVGDGFIEYDIPNAMIDGDNTMTNAEFVEWLTCDDYQKLMHERFWQNMKKWSVDNG